MNVYELIYVQLQLLLFRNEPVSQYLERELSCGQTYVESKRRQPCIRIFETRICQAQRIQSITHHTAGSA